ncbi:MAG TPA: hypothetical protein VJA16_08190, partial [Thermoanaerobaculia bacterium]
MTSRKRPSRSVAWISEAAPSTIPCCRCCGLDALELTVDPSPPQLAHQQLGVERIVLEQHDAQWVLVGCRRCLLRA